jgi:hypothetical protein
MIASLLLRAVFGVGVLLGTGFAFAQASEPPSVLRPGEDGLLGPYFESQLAGVAFRPPAGSREIRRVGNPDEIVSFVNEKKQWTLKASRLRFSQPIVLSAGEGAGGGGGGGGGAAAKPGLLELTVARLKEAPGAEVLRADVTAIGGNREQRGTSPNTAMIVVRYPLGGSPVLAQHAIVQATDSVFYALEFTSPGAPAGSGPDVTNENERQAVEVFTRIVDSLKFADRRDVRADQDERLIRTRTLLVNLTRQRVEKAVVPERWLRLKQGGRDVGYSYQVEEISERGGRPGLLVGVRTRTVPEVGGKVDAESTMFISFDRRYEEWRHAWQVTTPEGKRNAVTEIGAASMEDRRVLDRDMLPGDRTDPNQPPVVKVSDYRLTVTYGGGAASSPIVRDLPPFYLPQGLVHILPRTVPLKEAKGYMFASYITESREVIRRYVDVLPEAEVEFNGVKVRAVGVTERVGLEGARTTHWMTAGGEYIGSESPAAGILLLPSNAEELTKIWADADLSRPRLPAPNAPAVPSAPPVPSSPPATPGLPR